MDYAPSLCIVQEKLLATLNAGQELEKQMLVDRDERNREAKTIEDLVDAIDQEDTEQLNTASQRNDSSREGGTKNSYKYTTTSAVGSKPLSQVSKMSEACEEEKGPHSPPISQKGAFHDLWHSSSPATNLPKILESDQSSQQPGWQVQGVGKRNLGRRRSVMNDKQ
jgi:hypothetical protein